MELKEHFIKEINTFEDYNYIYMKKKIIISPIYLICVIIFQMCQICLEKKKTIFVSCLSLKKQLNKIFVSTLHKNDMKFIRIFIKETKMLKLPTILLNKNIKVEINTNNISEVDMKNILNGIKFSKNTLESFPFNNYKNSIMFLTDDESNNNFYKGILSKLKKILKTYNKKNFIISTFSFFNDININLLVDISFVGTLFLIYMSNLLSIIIFNVILSQNYKKKEFSIGNLFICIYRNVLLKNDKILLLNNKIFVEIPMIKQTLEVHINF